MYSGWVIRSYVRIRIQTSGAAPGNRLSRRGPLTARNSAGYDAPDRARRRPRRVHAARRRPVRAARAAAGGAPARHVRAARRVRRARGVAASRPPSASCARRPASARCTSSSCAPTPRPTATRAAGCPRSPTWRSSGPRRCRRSGPPSRDASWHRVDALPELALDHAQIVDDGLWRLRARRRRQGLVRARGRRPARRAVHAAPGPAALRGAARRGGRRRQLPPRRARHRPARGHRRAPLRGPGRPGKLYRRRPA